MLLNHRIMNAQTLQIQPNLMDYHLLRQSFSWDNDYNYYGLSGLPGDKGLNIAYEAVSRHAAGKLKNHVAIRWIRKDRSTKDYTYTDLENLTGKFAAVLNSLGIQKGDVVSTLLGRVPELYITALGTLKMTAVFCPLFSVFGPDPVFQRLMRGDSKILVTTLDLFNQKIKHQLKKLPQLQYILIIDAEDNLNDQVLSFSSLMLKASRSFTIPPTQEDDAALLHFTSGTTGMPKGALHVHRAVLIHTITGKYVLDFHPEDIYWCTADPGWVTGTSYGIIAPLVNGITNIVDEDEFDAARWYSILEEHKVSIWYTAPTAFRRLMRMNIQPRKQYNLEHLRLILSVGEPLHPEAVRWGEKTFETPVLDNWWQTETGGIMISNYRKMQVRPGSMGKPLPGIDAAIVNISDHKFQILEEPDKPGHLVLKKGWPSMFKTYIHEEERYQKCFHDDWYITGDLARRDVDGYYWFVGRADDIIKTSGHMVGPFEVESCLMEYPEVAEAAVIGKPDPLIGEMVKAFVVLKVKSKASDTLKLSIIAHARKKLGSAVAPKEIDFIDSLPKTKSGKILRRLLKARELDLPEGDISTLEKSE